jgi:hypothetical protein
MSHRNHVVAVLLVLLLVLSACTNQDEKEEDRSGVIPLLLLLICAPVILLVLLLLFLWWQRRRREREVPLPETAAPAGEPKPPAPTEEPVPADLGRVEEAVSAEEEAAPPPEEVVVEPVEQAKPLAFGREVAAEISTPNQVVVFAFEGQVGHQLSFFVSSEDFSAVQMRLFLRNPDGDKVAENGGVGTVSLEKVILTVEGAYTLQVSAMEQATGACSVRAYDIVPTEPVPLTLGEEVSGQLAPTAKDRYTFEGRAGQQVSFFVSSNELNQIYMKLTLFGPDGERVASKDWNSLENIALPTDGTYVFELDMQGERAGAYALRTQID